jgi:hypothetical protein
MNLMKMGKFKWGRWRLYWTRQVDEEEDKDDDDDDEDTKTEEEQEQDDQEVN